MTKRDHKPAHPGEILLEKFMKPLNLSQYRLAKELRISPIRINQIIHGKRAITADTAIRLACLLNMEAAFWMNLQSTYELELAMQESYAKIHQAIKPLETRQAREQSAPKKRKTVAKAPRKITALTARTAAKNSDDLSDFSVLLKKLDRFALNFKVDKKIRK